MEEQHGDQLGGIIDVTHQKAVILPHLSALFNYSVSNCEIKQCHLSCFQPLTYREWNGPHLKYLVWWRRRDSREEWKNATTKWLKYYIYDADTFTPYELKIQAVNDFGLGPESPVVTGYSGEGRKYIFIQCDNFFTYIFPLSVFSNQIWRKLL